LGLRQLLLLHTCSGTVTKGLLKDVAQNQSKELINANTLSLSIKLLIQKGFILILARLEKKDLKQSFSIQDTNIYIMLVFLKEKKVSNLFYLYSI
jgi:hypothetical protein